MTSIADPVRESERPSWLRTVLLLGALALFGAQTSVPWGRLWLLVPAAVAVSLLASWRFGVRGVLVPAALFLLAVVLEGPLSLWVWWIPVASLVGFWMGLREEGGGPAAGERAWMLLPVLVLAASLPWASPYSDLVNRVEDELAAGDAQLLELGRRLGYPEERLSALGRAVDEQASMRRRILPHVLPTALFVWVALLVAAGRSFSAQAAGVFKWPPLSRSPLRNWRLPDGALALFLAGLGILLLQWKSWAPTAWTLLLNAGLGYCVQGIAVVESLLLARGVPPSIIVLSLVFVFMLAMPLFMVATVALGLSDVWLDYRKLEPTPEGSER